MDIILCGAQGRMGREMAQEILHHQNMKLVAAVDKAMPSCEMQTCGVMHTYDCPCYTCISDVREEAHMIVDFSHHTATKELVDAAVMRSLPLVIATTGQTDEEREYIQKASESIPIFFCGNMSLGVTLFISLVARVAKTFYYADVEIVETHHKNKVDSPSGTALMIANAIIDARGGGRIVFGKREGVREKGDIGISSIRIGGVVGEHEVHIDTGFQRITLKHEALSRAIYTKGTLHAMDFILNKDSGLFSVKDFM